MPICKSLVSAEHLARIKSAPASDHVRVLDESDFGDGFYLVTVESDLALAGRNMQVVVIEGDSVRFVDDLDT